MRMPSQTTAQHRFSEVPKATIERSVFDRTSSHKTTFMPDYLIPFFIDEVLPGDTFNVDTTMFIRMTSPLTVPIMDNMYVDTFYFYVPLRLLWTNFQKFMGEQANPGDSVSYTMPQIVADGATGFVKSSLSDYFGLPTGVNSLSVVSMWHRAYNLIWNQWFRDQNIQNSVTVDTGNGPDTITNYVLLKRGKRHDYFTSCLPNPQKGTAVSLPFSGTANVIGVGVRGLGVGDGAHNAYETPNITRSYADQSDGLAGFNITMELDATTHYPKVFADLSTATATTINALRLAFAQQKMLERDARGGTRYTEVIKAHFGVTSPDARLQRPEFLGGKSSPIQISSVPQTSATGLTGGTTGTGNLSAFALGTNTRDGFTKSFTEHGVLIGLCMVRADLTYQKSLDRMFTRSTRLDFYWPALSHIGEQAVLAKEIYCDGSGNDAVVFGYQERYAEYRYARSKITGSLNSHVTTPLDVWHLAQKFASVPTLSDTFIKEAMPITRVEAVTTQDAFVMDCFIKNKTVRPMPVYSVPEKIDVF